MPERIRGPPEMLTQSDADQCAEEVAAEFLGLSYDQLEGLWRQQRDFEYYLARGRRHHGERVHADIVLEKFGLFRKRVSVEITVTPVDLKPGTLVGCMYFERFRSGKISPAKYASIHPRSPSGQRTIRW